MTRAAPLAGSVASPAVSLSAAASLVVALALGMPSPAAAEAPSPASPEGRWRLSLSLPVEQTAPVVGELERRFELTGLVDVRADREGFTQQTRACAFAITGGGFASSVEVPDTFLDAIQVPASPLEASSDGIVTVLHGIHLGYESDHGNEDPPRHASDPRVRDSDGDGNPGVTVILRVLQLGEVELYVTQHLRLRLEGVRREQEGGEERYEGIVRVGRFEQHVIGSTPSLPWLTDALVTRAKEGRFTLERVGDDATCETVIARSR